METVVTAERVAFDRIKKFWVDRGSKGNGFKASPAEHQQQTARIQSILAARLKPTDFYKNGMDFGCGYGRFLPVLANYCGHIWAVDVVDAFLKQVGSGSFNNVTPVFADWPFHLPCQSVDFLWTCLTLQHITDQAVFNETTAKLRRVLQPGARVMILDNAMDRAPHVALRNAAELAGAFNLAPGYFVEKVTLNKRPLDHWFIDGLVARA